MIIATTITNFCILGINFFTSILAARTLGPDGRGALALILLYPQAVAHIGVLGTDRAISILGGKNELINPVGAIAMISLVLAVPSVVLSYSFVTTQLVDQQLIRLSLLYTTYTPALYWFLLTTSWFNGLGYFREYNLSRFSFYMGYLVLLLALGIGGIPRLERFVYANLLSVYVSVLVSGYLLVMRVRGNRFVSWPSLDEDCRNIARKALIFVIPGTMTILASKIDQIVLAWFLPVGSLGLFVIYLTYSRLIGPVANAVSVTVFSRSISEVNQDLSRLVRLSVFVYVLLLFGMCVVTPFVVKLLYGNEYLAYVNAARLLLLSALFYFVAQIFSEYLKGKSRTRQDTFSLVLYIAVSALVGWILVPRLSIIGMAVAVVCGDAFRFVYLMILFSRRTGYRVFDLLVLRAEDAVWLVTTLMKMIPRKLLARTTKSNN